MKTLVKNICFVWIALLSVHSLDAQPLKRTLKGLTEKTVQEEAARAVAVSQAAVKAVRGQHPDGIPVWEPLLERKLRYQVKQAVVAARQLTRQQLLKEKMQRSVFMVVPEASGVNGRSAGFIFETVRQGKRELWGVTAGLLGPETELTVRFFKDGTARDFTGQVVQTGMAIPAGVILLAFTPTKTFLDTVIPLKLAASDVHPQMRVLSYGYFLQGKKTDFLPFSRGQLAQASPGMLITEDLLNVPNYTGMLGAPLFNRRHEVIGLYAGSFSQNEETPVYGRWRIQVLQPAASSYKDASYAVPAQRLAELVLAYHNGGLLARPVRWRGTDIAVLEPDERIFRVFTFRPAESGEQALAEHYLGPHQRGFVSTSSDTWGKVLDEVRFEQFVSVPDAVAVELWIEKYDGTIRQTSALLEKGRVGAVEEGPAEWLLDNRTDE